MYSNDRYHLAPDCRQAAYLSYILKFTFLAHEQHISKVQLDPFKQRLIPCRRERRQKKKRLRAKQLCTCACFFLRHPLQNNNVIIIMAQFSILLKLNSSLRIQLDLVGAASLTDKVHRPSVLDNFKIAC